LIAAIVEGVQAFIDKRVNELDSGAGVNRFGRGAG
jgi:hypothetical protein